MGTIFLLFKIGAERYAIEGTRIVTVLPLLPLKPVPGTPAGIAGVVNYHGVVVPVVDLQAMLLGIGTAPRLSTRLFLVRYAEGERLIALMVGTATESIRLNRSEFQPAGVVGTPCLGPVITLPRGIVQKIEPEAVLSPAVREELEAAMRAAEKREEAAG